MVQGGEGAEHDMVTKPHAKSEYIVNARVGMKDCGNMDNSLAG